MLKGYKQFSAKKISVFALLVIATLSVPTIFTYSKDENENIKKPTMEVTDGYAIEEPCPYRSEPFMVNILDENGYEHEYRLIIRYNLVPEQDVTVTGDALKKLDDKFKEIFEEYTYEDFTKYNAIESTYKDFRSFLDENNMKGENAGKVRGELGRAGFYIESIMGNNDDDFFHFIMDNPMFDITTPH